jgi:two-component system heavy metal sensor histidine kinase CusS
MSAQPRFLGLQLPFGPHTLSLRLALLFALVSAMLFGVIGFYLLNALDREIRWRDDQALLGRVVRMRSLIGDSVSIAALKNRPQLYENMLGNRESLLFVLDAAGRPVIEVNPAGIKVPRPPLASSIALGDGPESPSDAGAAAGISYRMAWQQVSHEGRPLTLIAGSLNTGREQMLAAYRRTLMVALTLGTLLAFALGWWVSQRSLRPVRALARQALAIDTQHLHLRLQGFEQLKELQALSSALNQMLARLETGFTQLARFSEDLAHEMRTPLANLMGQTQLALQHSRSNAEYQDLLASNIEEYERLARMTDNMLFIARAEQPHAAIAPGAVELHAMVALLCEYFEGMAEERGVTLVNTASGTVIADADLLRRALANLLANALRYGSEGREITIDSAHEADGTAELRVHNFCDAAIPPDELARLFDRFYRRDPARAEQGDSGGLGLAIVRSIMQLHGGSAWAVVDGPDAAGHAIAAVTTAPGGDVPLPHRGDGQASGITFGLRLAPRPCGLLAQVSDNHQRRAPPAVRSSDLAPPAPETPGATAGEASAWQPRPGKPHRPRTAPGCR